MSIFFSDLPPAIGYAASVVSAAIILHNARTASWRSLNAPGAFSAWCFSIIALPLLWRFRVPLENGVALHLMGVPIFVLMFGHRLAMAGTALSVLAYTITFDANWGNVGANILLMAILPAYCGEAVMRATARFLPHHMFVYLLGNGFFGALIMLATAGLLSLGVHQALLATVPIGVDTIAYMLLLAWGESFLTGFLLTIFTVYRPAWVLTFDDNVYLQGK